MELTSEDVRDILQLLDGLPYRELTLETASFRLSLRRAADGGPVRPSRGAGRGDHSL